MREQGCQQWHFDGGDMVTTLLLQAPQGGGEFAYLAGLRAPGDENYAGVQRVLDGASVRVRRIVLRAGHLTLFRGHYSLHRVARVRGSRPRLQAILGYTTVSGCRGKLRSGIVHYGPRVACIEGVGVDGERVRPRPC